MTKQWLIWAIPVWLVVWAILEKLDYERRKKRDPYWSVNDP